MRLLTGISENVGAIAAATLVFLAILGGVLHAVGKRGAAERVEGFLDRLAGILLRLLREKEPPATAAPREPLESTVATSEQGLSEPVSRQLQEVPLVDQVLAAPPAEAMDLVAVWLMKAIPDLNLVSIHRVDWHAGTYSRVGLAGDESLLTDFGRSEQAFPIRTRRGVIAHTLQNAIEDHTRSDIYVRDVSADARHLAMDCRTRSEFARVAFFLGRPVLVVNLESPTVGRFDEQDGEWTPAIQRAVHVLQQRPVIEHVRKMLFGYSIRLATLRDRSVFETNREGVLDLLDEIAERGREVIRASGIEPPEFIALHVLRSKHAVDRLYGLSLAKIHQESRAQFEAAIEAYIPGRHDPVKYVLREAELAVRGGKDPPAVPLRTVLSEAKSCVPPGIEHSSFLAAPIVDDAGDWIGCFVGHYLRRGRVEFDHFSQYVLMLYTRELAAFMQNRREGWFRVARSSWQTRTAG